MDLDTNDLLALVLAALAFGTVFWLGLRYRRMHDPEIVAAILPRLYIALAYVAIIVFDPELAASRLTIRLGLLVLLVFENVNHIAKRRTGK